MYRKVYLTSDGVGHQHQRGYEDFDIVGYICEICPLSTRPRVEVMEDINTRCSVDWCASIWEIIPTDELWTMCGSDETFASRVQFANLDFIGTPFEHRYNEFVFIRNEVFRYEYMAHLIPFENYKEKSLRSRYRLLMTALAKQERATWGTHVKAFIPFKSSNPQGYQGIWGNFDKPLTHDRKSIYGHDKFDSGIHILKVCWDR